jgi:predicted DNA-binding transcriptional regulator YafY
VYVATEKFKPRFPSSDAQRYLNELLAQAAGGAGVGESFVGSLPPIATVPTPARRLDGDVLAALVRAIRNVHALNVVYQSIGKPAPTTRTLTPTAIAHDGFRWHVRAFCHTHKDFRDFVIARILKVAGVGPAGAKAEDDVEWRNILQLVLAAHPNLSVAARRAIEFDFGMTKGQVVFDCRQALLFYVLRHLRLSPTEDSRPEAQQIVLRNADALRPYIKTEAHAPT